MSHTQTVSHEALTSDLMDEVEHLHARVEELEGKWKDMLDSVKHKAKAAAKAVKGGVNHAAHAIAQATRKRAITEHDITELLRKEFGKGVRINNMADPERWEFQLHGARAYVTHAAGAADAVFFDGRSEHRCASFNDLRDKVAAAKAGGGSMASAADLRGYSAAILRQQAALLEG
jgi:hypothetical protein